VWHSEHDPSRRRIRSLIDIATTLDLLARAVTERGERLVFPPVPDPTDLPVHDPGRSAVLRRARPIPGTRPGRTARRNSRLRVRDLYRRGRPSVVLTLGALAILAAAQRSPDRGCALGDVLERAAVAAAGFPDLLPDGALRAATGARVTTALAPSWVSSQTNKQDAPCGGSAGRLPAPHGGCCWPVTSPVRAGRFGDWGGKTSGVWCCERCGLVMWDADRFAVRGHLHAARARELRLPVPRPARSRCDRCNNLGPSLVRFRLAGGTVDDVTQQIRVPARSRWMRSARRRPPPTASVVALRQRHCRHPWGGTTAST
jgi:hypothetical protein